MREFANFNELCRLLCPPRFLRCSVWSPSLFVISDGAHPNLEVKALPESHDARNVKAVAVRSTGVMSVWMDGGS